MVKRPKFKTNPVPKLRDWGSTQKLLLLQSENT
jgi:hypothetical protein